MVNTTLHKRILGACIGLLGLALLAGCGTAPAPTSGAAGTPGADKPLLAVAYATATTDHALGLAAPADATALDPAAARPMLAQLFPSPYAPVEQSGYVTRQPGAALEAFYSTTLADAGYTPEVTWADLSQGMRGASWAKASTQVRVILNTALSATAATSLNSTFHLATPALQPGDTLVYLMGIDRDKALK